MNNQGRLQRHGMDHPMTLIVASIRPDDVVLTADGRSVTMEKGTVAAVNDHFQKLFPIPDHPVAIAHMGENDLGGEPLGQFLGRFVRRLNTGNYTILEISDQLRAYAHAAIRARLRSLGNPAFGCNLWVVGFSCHETGPSLVEVFWRLKDEVLTTEERRFVPTSVVPGGAGVGQIHKVDWRAVEGKSIKEVRAYHKNLMDEAVQAPLKPNSVGGRVHELVITREAWRWTQPPDGRDK